MKTTEKSAREALGKWEEMRSHGYAQSIEAKRQKRIVLKYLYENYLSFNTANLLKLGSKEYAKYLCTTGCGEYGGIGIETTGYYNINKFICKKCVRTYQFLENEKIAE